MSNPTAAGESNGTAIASLITSVSAIPLVLFCIGPVVGLVGAILGHVALRQIKRTGQSGRAMALGGILVGWIAVAMIVPVMFLVQRFLYHYQN